MNIKDKVAIVTGGTAGIGLATVEALLKNKAKYVAIFDLESAEERGVSCVEKLEKQFGEGCTGYYSCDVTERTVFAARYDEIVGSKRSVDIVINCAGILSDSQIEKEIDINFKGVVHGTLVAIDRMGRHHQGQGGTIINIASILGLTTHPAVPIYCATKYAVYGFTKALKDYDQLLGVRVMTVCPGFTNTSIVLPSADKSEPKTLNFVPDELYQDALKLQPHQRPENVASAIITVIEKGKAGEAWVSELDKPPYVVEDPVFYSKRKRPDDK